MGPGRRRPPNTTRTDPNDPLRHLPPLGVTGSTTTVWPVCTDDSSGTCVVWGYLQGTSMASPHVAGLAALVIETYGKRKGHGYSMDPDTVAQVIERSAIDHTCPVGGTEIYTDEGRPRGLERAVRRHDCGQQPVRRGHRQRGDRDERPEAVTT